MRLRVGHLSTFYHTAPLIMARGEGALRLGEEPHWRLFGTGPAIVDAFAAEELDLAYIGLPPAIIGISRGVNIVCVAGGHVEGTVISGRPEYRGYPELDGLTAVLSQAESLTVGVPGKGSIHDIILDDALSAQGLRDKVRVVNFSWADAIIDAFKAEEVDMAVGTPALAVALDRYAGGRLLVPAHAIWPGNPSYGICVRRGLLEEAPGLVEEFLRMHEDASCFLTDSPAEAAREISAYLGFIDADYVMDTLALSPKYCASLTPEYMACTMSFMDAMLRSGYIRTAVEQQDIFDTAIISRIHPSGGHYEASSKRRV